MYTGSVGGACLGPWLPLNLKHLLLPVRACTVTSCNPRCLSKNVVTENVWSKSFVICLFHVCIQVYISFLSFLCRFSQFSQFSQYSQFSMPVFSVFSVLSLFCVGFSQFSQFRFSQFSKFSQFPSAGFLIFLSFLYIKWGDDHGCRFRWNVCFLTIRDLGHILKHEWPLG